MGIRGKNSRPTRRATPKNLLRNSRYREPIVADSVAFWDLCNGTPEYWPDRFDAEREQAWREWSERIFRRWPKRHGHRPAGWWDFAFPPLLACAWADGRFTEAQTDAMSDSELVYWLDATEPERAQIEEQWEKGIANARHFARPRTAARRDAVKKWDVPSWFFDQSTGSSGNLRVECTAPGP